VVQQEQQILVVEEGLVVFYKLIVLQFVVEQL
jgi:hypothetical protein